MMLATMNFRDSKNGKSWERLSYLDLWKRSFECIDGILSRLYGRLIDVRLDFRSNHYDLTL